ncbi:MAG: hypothetical protein M1833_003973 [Piccolia ochrophora]|nr:MAG: hypothetical protein M1833_003973 [Piccolia ochrophora]
MLNKAFALVLLAAAPIMAQVKYAGLNMPGFEFGCQPDEEAGEMWGGSCDLSRVYAPEDIWTRQMNHFVQDSKLNAFRIPVTWQYLVWNQLGQPVNDTSAATYERIIQACLNAGAALCMIDFHNFARYDSEVIGQGGPSDQDFASIWGQIATRYATEERVAFNIMNEPYDLDISTWANTMQAAVDAIRNAGATSQMILLPGANFTSAREFLNSGSGDALNSIQNPDGTKNGLVFDVHQYLDGNGSGGEGVCTVPDPTGIFRDLTQWLKDNGRQAFLTEIGGGDDSSCYDQVCQVFDHLNENSKQYLGWLGWGAGSLTPPNILSEVPIQNGNRLEDVELVKRCIAGKFGNSASLNGTCSGASLNSTSKRTVRARLRR